MVAKIKRIILKDKWYVKLQDGEYFPVKVILTPEQPKERNYKFCTRYW